MFINKIAAFFVVVSFLVSGPVMANWSWTGNVTSLQTYTDGKVTFYLDGSLSSGGSDWTCADGKFVVEGDQNAKSLYPFSPLMAS